MIKPLIRGVQEPEEEGEQIRPVAGILLHPEFNPKSLINDVAVLLVDRPFELSENIGPVCLPAPGSVVEVNTSCVATGHGKDEDIGYFTNTLRKVSLPIWSSVECENSLNRNYFQQNHSITWRIHESFLCAGGQAGRDACTGDGGGPLMCPLGSEPQRMIQIGVVSWGLQCGMAVPGVYADLVRPEANNWVVETVRNLQQPRAGSFDVTLVKKQEVSAAAWG